MMRYLSLVMMILWLSTSAVWAQEGDALPLPELYEQVSPSVVFIEVIKQSVDGTFQSDFESQALGSGFVYDTQGHIVTNYHVVEDAIRITVTFFDGPFARAEVVGLDPDSDLAVIKVEVDPAVLRPVTFADSGLLRVGENTIAIGHPFGENWTMTTGIISSLGRSNLAVSGFSIASMIQTDAAINRGNSGGPLLDAAGHVIGVNTMIASENSLNSGVGFAVPSNTIQRVVPELIQNGDYQYTWLGISGSEVTLNEIELMELDDATRGVLIARVYGGSPAGDANLRGNNGTGNIGNISYPIGGDIITHINNEPMADMADVVNFLAERTRPGDVIQVQIIRNGEVMSLAMTLQARPESVR